LQLGEVFSSCEECIRLIIQDEALIQRQSLIGFD
jgi:hypothetical protein